jgi:hypothetical protein
MDMIYEQQPVLPSITTPPPLSRYLLRSRHKTATTFICKLLPLLINEFTYAPFTVIASITTSDIDCNNSVTVTFSTDSFGSSFPETILASGIHPTLCLDLRYDVDRYRCQLVKMDLGTPSHILSQWKSRLQYEYILSIDTIYVHTITDVRLIISEAPLAKRTSIVISFTKDDAPNCLSVVGLPQIYFDQLQIMRGHIEHTVLTVFLKAITGPKFNCRTLQKQLDWKYWLAVEWIQLDNYAKQETFLEVLALRILTRTPSSGCGCIRSSLKRTTARKVRGICDGSTRGGKTMAHGATYAPTPQQTDVRIQIAMSALLGMYLWHANVTNAFTEADRRKQIYYMRCNQVFKYWWKTRHPDISLPPDTVVPVLNNLQGHPEGPRLWAIHCHLFLITLKFKKATHALRLYHVTFNGECVLFLHMVDDFFIACKLEKTYSKLCELLEKNWQVPMS